MNTLKAIELLCIEINKLYTDFTDYVFTTKESVIELEYKNLSITLNFKDNGNGTFRDLRFEFFGQLLSGWRKIGGILQVDEIALVKVFKEVYSARYKELEIEYNEEHQAELDDETAEFYENQHYDTIINNVLDK